MDAFKIQNLSFSYPLGKQKALNRVSLSVQEGEFLLLCGRSGCGKSTLLRQLKPSLAPHGAKEGTILFFGKTLDSLDHRTQAKEIGYVLQSPDNQIVTDKVWHELAFGLESLGERTETIRLRVAEMASFFGIESWFLKEVTQLSGGQKQLLNLASVMAMQPSVLILDEPTSQLDPIAASDFLETVKKINRELGVTVILSEQRLEEVMPISDRVIVMENGEIFADGTAVQIGEILKSTKNKMFLAMPSPMQIYAGVESDLPCPVTVRDGRRWLNKIVPDSMGEPQPVETEPSSSREPIVEMRDVWFRYEKTGEDIVRGLNLAVFPGQLYAIVGGNGTGKTTALSLMCGVLRPYRGKIFLAGRDIFKIPPQELYRKFLGVLPQNPQTVFVKKTVEADLLEMLEKSHFSKSEKTQQVAQVGALCEITALFQRHPYDLSGGEQQRVALAKILLLSPKMLFLDEPTKGMDAHFKEVFAGILNTLLKNGVTIVMVSHDVEFCARHAHRCALFFEGNTVTEGSPRSFFSGNSFYTTAANRMARHKFPGAITVEDVILACNRTKR